MDRLLAVSSTHLEHIRELEYEPWSYVSPLVLVNHIVVLPTDDPSDLKRLSMLPGILGKSGNAPNTNKKNG